MKYYQLSIIIALSAIFTSNTLFPQTTGSGQIVKQERQVGEFDAIKLDGAQEAHLMQGDNYTVVIETQENLLDKISIVIKNNMLSFEYKDIKKYDVMKYYITAPTYKKLAISGASDVYSSDTLSGENLKITATGASEAKLVLDYASVLSKVSGASELTLSGKAASHVIEASGASEVKAKSFITESTSINASGASECFVEAKSNLTYKVSGASSVQYVNKPKTLIIQNSSGSKNVVIMKDSTKTSTYYSYDDTTTVNLGVLDVEVIDGDTTKVSVGRHTIVVDDNGNVKYHRNKKLKFNGHWGGVEIGINGYFTPDFNTNWGKEYDYLNLRYEKSIAVNLNIYEQNIALNKAKNLGLVTGIGMAWNNWRFSQTTYLSPDSSNIKGYYMVNTDGSNLSVRKTKLTAMYITVPIMFEVQTKNPNRYKRFHFGIGALVSARVRTHTKIYFNEANKAYQMKDPGTDEIYALEYRTPNTTHRNIIKEYNSFQLQPFRFDGMVRIGFGIINLWGHFGLNQFFKKDRGPELYTWAAGITLVGW
jgi:hypothetical protein